MTRLRPVIVLVAVLPLLGLLAACGDDDDGADDAGGIEPATTAAEAATTTSPTATTTAPATTAPASTAEPDPTTTEGAQDDDGAPGTSEASPGGTRGLAGLVGDALASGSAVDNQCIAEEAGPDVVERASAGEIDRATALALAQAAEACGVSLAETDEVPVSPEQLTCVIENVEDETFAILAAGEDPTADAMIDTIDALDGCDIDVAALAGLEGVSSEQANCLFSNVDPGTLDVLLADGQPTGAQFQDVIGALDTCEIDPSVFVPGGLGDVPADQVFCLFGELEPETVEEIVAGGEQPSDDALTDVLEAMVDCDVDPSAFG